MSDNEKVKEPINNIKRAFGDVVQNFSPVKFVIFQKTEMQYMTKPAKEKLMPIMDKILYNNNIFILRCITNITKIALNQ